MKNILRNRTILGIASILLSLIICFGLTPLFNDAIEAKITIVRVTETIEKGELITSDQIKLVEVGGYNMPDAVSVSIKSFAAGLSGKLEPGDIVSILVSDYGELKETVSPIELLYVQVLAVTAGSGLDTDEYEKNNKAIEDEKELPSTLTLKVSAEQAKLLTELEVKGRIHTVFVFRGDKENTQKFLDEQEKLLIVEEVVEEEIDNEHFDLEEAIYAE